MIVKSKGIVWACPIFSCIQIQFLKTPKILSSAFTYKCLEPLEVALLGCGLLLTEAEGSKALLSFHTYFIFIFWTCTNNYMWFL